MISTKNSGIEMYDLLLFIVSVFAVYRISLMIAFEDGPAWSLVILREDIIKTLVSTKNFWIYKGFNCPLCIGFWLSFIPAILFWDGLFVYLIYVLGIAGAQTFLTIIGGVPDNEG